MNNRAIDIVRDVAHVLSVEENLTARDMYTMVRKLEEAQALLLVMASKAAVNEVSKDFSYYDAAPF